MDKQLRNDLIVVCSGLAGLVVGQVLADRLTTRSPQAPSAVSAARLASAMALAQRTDRLLGGRRASVSTHAVLAFASAAATVVAVPALSRLLQSQASHQHRSRGRG